MLEELVSLAGEDHAINAGINRFLDDILVDTGRLMESSKEALAKANAQKKPELEISIVGATRSFFEQIKSAAHSGARTHILGTESTPRAADADFEVVDEDHV